MQQNFNSMRFHAGAVIGMLSLVSGARGQCPLP